LYKIKYNNNTIEEGFFKDNEFIKGKRINSDGSIEEGFFKDGYLNG
tara:strand:- start:10 stop:147 length:138 start_codon:yes stop_codon:yes gene_type:complete